MTEETPMRERIALALATAIDHQTEWDSLTLEQERWIFQLVDAVLDAMREPTKGMIEAAYKAPMLGGLKSQYQFAIDAAKEGK